MNKKRRYRPGLSWWYVSVTILIVVVVCALLALGVYYLLGIFNIVEEESLSTLGIIASIIAAISIAGALAAGIVFRSFTKPMDECITAINEFADGNYDIKLDTAKGRDQLRELKEAINKTAGELSNTEVMRTDFINTVSHEYKTPVASILGYARLLKGSDLTPAQQEYVDIIIEESHHLATTTTNVLLLSKFENTGIVTDKKVFSLDEQLRRCFVHLQNEWLGKDISISGDFSKVEYYGNEEIMGHIWSNIAENAIKFTERGGEIFCSVKQVGGNAVVKIADNGRGMDAETLKHIFDKFYQKEDSGRTRGNGLGLAIAKQAAELCGGEIQVKSEPDSGTEFTVILPLQEKKT